MAPGRQMGWGIQSWNFDISNSYIIHSHHSTLLHKNKGQLLLIIPTNNYSSILMVWMRMARETRMFWLSQLGELFGKNREVCPCWKTCVIGGGLWSFKCPWHPLCQWIPCKFSATALESVMMPSPLWSGLNLSGNLRPKLKMLSFVSFLSHGIFSWQ